jgi:predicted RNA-binding Zn ribbon-like protein
MSAPAPELLLRLANLDVVRKPGRGPSFKPEPLVSTESAAQALGADCVSSGDLAGLRELHEVVIELVTRLLDGRALDDPVGRLTTLARPSDARISLEVTDEGELRDRLEWSDPTLVAGLARRVVVELAAMEPGRLRRCARPECDLVFYDTTRSNTQRWHADSPCGNRERQRRFRAAHEAR